MHAEIPAGGTKHLGLEGSIGVNLSPLVAKYRNSPAEWVSCGARIVETLVERLRRRVVLVPHVVLRKSDDRSYLDEVQQLVGMPDQVTLLRESYTAPELKYLIGQLSVFIGARTHATIASMSMGVPTVSLGYSVKARGINRDLFGHDDFVLDVRSITPDSVADITHNVLRSEERRGGKEC